MIIFIVVFVSILLLIMGYQVGVRVERNTWRYGEHFIENAIAYRLKRDKNGNRQREML